MKKKAHNKARKPPRLIGVTARDYVVGDDVLERAKAEWNKTNAREKKRSAQVIEFDAGPIGVAFTADHHFGGPGVDYQRAFDEAQIITATPHLYAATVGDLVDDFIIAKLAHVRRENRLTLPDEWALVDRYLKLIGPKLLLAVGGNHEYWMHLLTGLDVFRDALTAINPDALYDTDECRVTMRVAGVEWPGRIRHKWRGSSIYNDTHGIERAQKWDQDFVWGVGAHIHTSGLARQFNAAGGYGLAMLCGSYKRVDLYSRQGGYHKPNASTAVVIVFDPESGTMNGFNDLSFAARVLTSLHGK